jgi:hypothetical protein
MRQLISLRAFITADIMFAWNKNAIPFINFTKGTFIAFFLLSFSIRITYLTLVDQITPKFKLSQICQ